MLWWLLTGGVFWLCRRSPASFPISFMLGLALFGAGFSALEWSSNRTDLAGLYCAFTSALVLWSFQELTFYLGYVTGPRTKSCKPGCRGWRHFGHAVSASLYHELSIVLTAALLLLITWDKPNQLGLYTFLLIWVMHQSARLNVFLGVRNVSAEWVPPHLTVLRSFLRQAPMNPFFLPSVAALTGGLFWLVSGAIAAPVSSPSEISLIFLASLLGLALVEHLCLMLPVPLTALWRLFGAPKPANEPMAPPAGRPL